MPREITVNVKLNTNGVDTSISALESKLKALQSPVEIKIKTDGSAQTAVQRTTAALNDQERAIAKVAAAQAKLGQSSGVVSKAQATSLSAMQQYIQSLNGMSGASVKAIGSITNAAGTFQRYAVAVKDSDESVKTFKMSVNTATGEVYQLDTGIKSISNTAQNAGQALMSLGTSMVNSLKQIIGFYGMGTLIRNSLSEMKSMSDELATYKKVTRATADEVEQVRKEAYASAQKYGQSPSDFLGSVSTFARAGYKEKSSAMADLATKTMLVGDMSAEAASSFLITADAGYQLGGSIEALSAIVDKANIIDNNYATSLSKLADGFTIIAPLANTMGMSVDELMASLGTISAVTQRSGTETARALRALMLNIMGDTTTEIEDGVTATEESVESLQEVLQKYAKDALAAAKASGKALNPIKAIAALNAAWKNNDLNDADLMAIVSGLGGKLRSNELMAIIQNFDMFEGMLQRLQTESGSADDEVSAMMDSWSAKAQNLKTAFVEITNNSLREGFIKDLLDASTGFVKWTGSIENFIGVAGSGLKAISALSAGVKNLLNKQAFGGANAWTLGITTAIAVISAAKSAYENHYREMQQRAEESVKTAQEETKKASGLADIQKKYWEIAADGVDKQAGELGQLKTLQSQLNDLVGDQASGIDIVNGKYAEMAQRLEELSKQQLQQAIDKANIAAAEAKNNYRSQGLGSSAFSVRGKTFGELGYGLESIKYAIGQSVKKETYEILPQFMDRAFGKNGNIKYRKTTSREEGVDYFRLQFSLDKSEGIDELLTLKSEFEQLMAFMSAPFADGNSLATLEPDLFKEITYANNQFLKYANPLIEAQQNQINLSARLAIANSDIAKTTFESNEERDEAIRKLVEEEKAQGGAIKTTKAYADALTEQAKAQTRVKNSAEGSESGTDSQENAAENATKQYYTLVDAINAATDAKAKFDAQTSKTKADELNDYVAAWETLQKEIDAGKVNSNAAHAAYRMLMGDQQYFANGMSAKGSLKYLQNQHGAAGSIWDAYQILAQEYVNKATGKTVEGYGIVELMRKAGMRVEDEQGNIAIPAVTQALVDAISQAFGGLDKNVIWAAFNALDQYDEKGTATQMAIEKKDSELAENTGAIRDLTSAARDLIKKNKEETQTPEQKRAQQKAEGLAMAAEEQTESDYRALVKKAEAEAEAKAKAEAKAEAIKKIRREQAQGKAERLAQEAQKQMENDYPAAERARRAEEDARSIAENNKRLDEIQAQRKEWREYLERIEQESYVPKTTPEPSPTPPTAPEPGPSPAATPAPPTPEQKRAQQKAEEEASAKAEAEARAKAEAEARAKAEAEARAKAEAEARAKAEEEARNKRLDEIKTQRDEWREYLEKLDQEGYAPKTTPKPTPTPPTAPEPGPSPAATPAPNKITVPADIIPQGIVDEGKNDLTVSANVNLDAESAEKEKEKLENGAETTVTAEADTKDAKNAIDKLTEPRTVEITTKVVGGEGVASPSVVGSYGPGIGGGGGGLSLYDPTGLSYSIFAKGTRNHPGGLSMVNDGQDGPELIVERGRAFIAGGGKPTLVSLEKGAKVFTGRETKQILSGDGVPAYADGTKTGYGPGAINSVGPITNSGGPVIPKAEANNTVGGKPSEPNRKTWQDLAEMLNYILRRIQKALDQQLEIIDKQISALQAERDAADAQKELLEKQEAVTKAQNDLAEALNERTVRYLGDDGQWHWMADQGNVKSAQETLKDAQDDLQEYLDDQAFDAKIKELEDQKTRLQDEFSKITDAWSEIQDAVNTPTGVLADIIADVLKAGTDQQKKGAGEVKNALISDILRSAYEKNYEEALDAIAKATAGDPLMPSESDRLLSDLISKSSAAANDASGETLSQLLAAQESTRMSAGGALGGYIGQQTNNYYSINGFTIGAQEAEQPLSVTMQRLSVYANGNYS